MAAAAFLGALGLWGIFASLGEPLSPGEMAFLMALPPTQVALDLRLTVAFQGSTAPALAGLLGLELFRSVVLGLLSLLLVGALREGSPQLRAALRRLPRVAASIFGVIGAELGLFLVLLLVLPSLVGPSSVPLLFVAGLYFLGFAPVAAAVEDVPAGTALRLSFRAARLPGPGQLVVMAIYLVLVFAGAAAAALLPRGATSVTPTLLTWIATLALTLVHVAVLGAMIFRWLGVRERVVAGPAKPQKPVRGSGARRSDRAPDKARRGRDSARGTARQRARKPGAGTR